MFNFSEKSIVSATRFIAHLFSVLLIFVVLLLVIGEGFPNSLELKTNELLLTISLLIMLAGLLSAWKWELVGGILILLGFLAFFTVNSIYSGNLRFGFFFLLFPLTGSLYLFCCWRDRKIN